MNPQTRKRVEKHGQQLLALFPNCTEKDPVCLCSKLRRLEGKAHKLATDWCNGDVEEADFDRESKVILNSVGKLLSIWNHPVIGPHCPGVIFNADCRGYALKFSDTWSRDKQIHRDWGGYGILAPDLVNP